VLPERVTVGGVVSKWKRYFRGTFVTLTAGSAQASYFSPSLLLRLARVARSKTKSNEISRKQQKGCVCKTKTKKTSRLLRTKKGGCDLSEYSGKQREIRKYCKTQAAVTTYSSDHFWCALRAGRGAAHAAHYENGGYYDDDSAASDDRRDDAGGESSFAAVGRCLLLLSCLAVVGVG
jgi:hypothetical protein